MKKPAPPKTVADLMALLDLGEYAVRQGIERGELPGVKVGRFYRIPAEAFERFARGEWTPQPRPQVHEIKPVDLDSRRSA